MKDKSVVGDIINFRGLVYSPTNEDGVIFLFGKVMEDLNMYIEEIKPGYPDCIGRRFTRKGWEKISIEFEHKSSNFKDHKHDTEKCDLIVCWEHDWPECPLEVIELKEIIQTLPNKPIQRPDTGTGTGKTSMTNHLKKFPAHVAKLFKQFDERAKKISDEIWSKVTSRPGATYYTPERVFIYLRLQQQGLRLTIFTRGQKIKDVKNFEYERGGAKWGRIVIKDEKQLAKAFPVLKKSYTLIKEAIKNNESTGWYADIEEEN